MATDQLGRSLRDLRISITDRCNFRCTYCMPKEIFNREYQFLGRDLLLSFEEITRVAGITIEALGVEKLRITGGEPLMRKGVDELVSALAPLGAKDLALTTNAALLEKKAEALAAAGLNRVTVSLDSLDDQVFRAMNDVDFPVEKVLAGIDAAHTAGLGPVKVNAVVKRGVNDQSPVDMIRYFRGSGVVVRFIEYMDVGSSNGWRLDQVVPAKEIVESIVAEFPAGPVDPLYVGEVARRYRLDDGSAEFGIISSVTQPFCGDCTRARLSADGVLYTCLFANSGHDLRKLMRDGATDTELTTAITDIWAGRTDRYSELRTGSTRSTDRVEMSYIGG